MEDEKVPIKLLSAFIHFNMAILLTLFVTLFTGIVSYYIWHWTFWKRRGIPGPIGVPILGKSNTMLDDSIPPGMIMREWTKKYGKVYGFTEGMQKVLVISEPDLVQDLFVKQYDNFYGRKHNPAQGDPEKDKDVSIVAAQGYRWKRLRTITAPAFSNNSLKKVMGIMEDSSLEFMKHLEQKAGNGEVVNMHLWFQEFTMDVINRIAMGQNGSLMFNNPLLYDCKGFFENNRWPIWMLSGAFPFAVGFLKYLFLKLGLFGAGPFKTVMKTVSEAVGEREKLRTKEEDHEVEAHDFIDLFLGAKAEVEHFREENSNFHKSTIYDNRKLTIPETISQCFVFLVAGFDTTAISLSYVAYLSALHPEVQKKLQEEVDRECPHPEITFDQLSRLKYMENTIKESLRVYPLASFANARRCMRTTKLGDIQVEAGVDVMVDTWTLHHDKQIWGEDADEFKPERWSSPSIPSQNFLSFGAGPRQCLGMRLAYLEMKLLLAHVLRKYSFVTSVKTEIPMKLVGRATARPSNLFLAVESREL